MQAVTQKMYEALIFRYLSKHFRTEIEYLPAEDRWQVLLKTPFGYVIKDFDIKQCEDFEYLEKSAQQLVDNLITEKGNE